MHGNRVFKHTFAVVFMDVIPGIGIWVATFIRSGQPLGAGYPTAVFLIHTLLLRYSDGG